MKARIKATGEIVEVWPLYEPDEYKTDKGVYYDILEIELLDEYSPDYWTRLEHQYAGMALQGILANSAFDDVSVADIAITSTKLATSLIKRLKEEMK